MTTLRTMSCGRRAARKAVDLRCHVRPRGGRARRLRVTELSTHGAWLRTSSPLADGTHVEVALRLEGHRERRLRGEVMWTQTGGRRAGMGVEWLDLDDEARRWLARVLADQPEVSRKPSRFVYADAG